LLTTFSLLLQATFVKVNHAARQKAEREHQHRDMISRIICLEEFDRYVTGRSAFSALFAVMPAASVLNRSAGWLGCVQSRRNDQILGLAQHVARANHRGKPRLL
jgi:hypothetical protein